MGLTEYGWPDGYSDSGCESCHTKPGDENIYFFSSGFDIYIYKKKVLSRQSGEAFPQAIECLKDTQPKKTHTPFLPRILPGLRFFVFFF